MIGMKQSSYISDNSYNWRLYRNHKITRDQFYAGKRGTGFVRAKSMIAEMVIEGKLKTKKDMYAELARREQKQGTVHKSDHKPYIIPSQSDMKQFRKIDNQESVMHHRLGIQGNHAIYYMKSDSAPFRINAMTSSGFYKNYTSDYTIGCLKYNPTIGLQMDKKVKHQNAVQSAKADAELEQYYYRATHKYQWMPSADIKIKGARLFPQRSGNDYNIGYYSKFTSGPEKGRYLHKHYFPGYRSVSHLQFAPRKIWNKMMTAAHRPDLVHSIHGMSSIYQNTGKQHNMIRNKHQQVEINARTCWRREFGYVISMPTIKPIQLSLSQPVHKKHVPSYVAHIPNESQFEHNVYKITARLDNKRKYERHQKQVFDQRHPKHDILIKEAYAFQNSRSGSMQVGFVPQDAKTGRDLINTTFTNGKPDHLQFTSVMSFNHMLQRSGNGKHQPTSKTYDQYANPQDGWIEPFITKQKDVHVAAPLSPRGDVDMYHVSPVTHDESREPTKPKIQAEKQDSGPDL